VRVVIEDVEAEIVPESRAPVARRETPEEAPPIEPAGVRGLMARLAVRAARVRAD
jgi:hypothetical protein